MVLLYILVPCGAHWSNERQSASLPASQLVESRPGLRHTPAPISLSGLPLIVSYSDFEVVSHYDLEAAPVPEAMSIRHSNICDFMRICLSLGLMSEQRQWKFRHRFSRLLSLHFYNAFYAGRYFSQSLGSYYMFRWGESLAL